MVLALVSAAGVASCVGGADRTSAAQLNELRSRTLPADAEIVGEKPVTRTGYALEASWEFTTNMKLSEYFAWLRPRLVGFTSKNESAPSAIYVSSTDGDNFAIVIEELASEPNLHLKVTWRASAS